MSGKVRSCVWLVPIVSSEDIEKLDFIVGNNWKSSEFITISSFCKKW